MTKFKKPSKDEALEIIYQCARELSSSSWIPGYDKEDIEQEAIIIGLEALKKNNYNRSIPYKKYMGNHIRHRLRSLRRSKYLRSSCGCGECRNCKNNHEKQKIALPENIEEYYDDNSLCYKNKEKPISPETISKIDRAIPAEYREDYLKILAGVPIGYHRKIKIKEIISEIINDE